MKKNGDDLELQISATMTKANTAIDSLVKRLDTLSSKISAVNASGLGQLAASLDKLSTAAQGAQAISDMSKNIAKLGNKSVQNAIANMPQLATGVKNLITEISKAPKISTETIQLTNALANLASQGSKVGTASKTLVNGLNNTSNAMTRVNKSAWSLASAFGKFYASYFMVIRGIKCLWSSIESTTDYIEAFNYFDVAFGKIASEWSQDFERFGYENAEAYADSFTKRMTDSLGDLSGLTLDADKGLLTASGTKNLALNIQEITQSASQLASITNSIGLVGEVSLEASESFTKLAADMSSLFNIDFSSAMKNLQSGLIGQSRALYKYGIDITNATLQTYAYELGLSKAVSEMTQSEKMQLRMLAILDQSKVAWGDLANTINSPSNMIRQFTNNLKEAGMVLGQLFIPMLQKILPVLNGITIAIKNLLVNIASFFGVQLDLSSFGQGYADMEDGIDGVTDSLENATASAKKLKTATLGIDELNINAPQDTSGTSDGGIGSGIDLTNQIFGATEEYKKAWDEAFENMQNKAQEFAKIIEESLKKILPLVLGIGAGFLAWKIYNGVVSGLQAMSGNLSVLKGTIDAVSAGYGKLVALNVMQSFLPWAVVIGIIVARFADLTINSEKFSKGLERLQEIGSAVFDVILSLLSGIGTAIWDVVSGFAEWLGIDLSFLENWLASISEFVEKLDLDFADLAITLGGIALMFVPGGQIFGGILLGFEAITIGIRALGAIGDETWERIKVAAWAVGEALKYLFGTKLPAFFSEAWESIKETVSKTFNFIVITVSNAIVGVINFLVSGFETLINGAISGLNNLIELANKIPGIDISFRVSEVSFSRLPTYELPTYSTGGFPEDGLFMANRNELVGGFSNGHTAVANNEQIIEGIERGVERAVSNILAPYLADIVQNTRETADKDLTVAIGDREIARANARGQRSMGFALITE